MQESERKRRPICTHGHVTGDPVNDERERSLQIGNSVNDEVKRRDKLGKKLQEVNDSRSALPIWTYSVHSGSSTNQSKRWNYESPPL